MRVQKRATPTTGGIVGVGSRIGEDDSAIPLDNFTTFRPNSQCHQAITVEEAERILAEHRAAIRAVYPDPEAMCRVARERVERIGLVRWLNGGAMLVQRPHVGYCPVCDGW